MHRVLIWLNTVIQLYAVVNSFLAGCNFCPLLITFANSLDPDEAQHYVGPDHNVGPDLDPNYLTL